MSAKLKTAILTQAATIASEIATHAVEAGTLADNLLVSHRDALDAGLTVNSVWEAIAKANKWQDKDAKLKGEPMPKTLQVYRATFRKGEKVKANFALSWSAFKKEVADKAKGERAPNGKVNVTEVKGEAKAVMNEGTALEDVVVLPAIIKALMVKRAGLTIAKQKDIDNRVNALIATFN